MPLRIGSRRTTQGAYGSTFSPLSWQGAGLAAWYSPLFAPAGANVTEVTGAAGTGTVTQVSTAITGVGTQFVKECKVGDAISGTLISGNVVSITDATHMTVDASNSGAGAAFTITPVAGLSARVNRVYDQSGLGRHQDQATRSKMGALVANAYAGKPGLSTDGADDLWVNPTAYLVGSVGAVFAPWILPSGTIQNAVQVLLASADQGTVESHEMALGAYRSNANPNAEIVKVENAAINLLYGDTTILAATRVCSIQSSSGSAYGSRVNGVAQTLTVNAGSNNGAWFSSITLADNITLGAAKNSAEMYWFRGTLLDLCALDGVVPTLAHYLAYENWSQSIWP